VQQDVLAAPDDLAPLRIAEGSWADAREESQSDPQGEGEPVEELALDNPQVRAGRVSQDRRRYKRDAPREPVLGGARRPAPIRLLPQGVPFVSAPDAHRIANSCGH